MNPMDGRDSQDQQLDQLLVSYRQACPDVDASAEFMPRLWQRIESRRVENFSILKRLAQICVATAAAAIIVTTVLMPAPQDDGITSTYTEFLSAYHADEALVQVLPADLPGEF